MQKATEHIKIPFQYEVKRTNRWRFDFPIEFDIESWLIQSVSLPKFTKDEKGNFTEFKMSLTFINPIGPSSDTKIYQNFITKNKKDFECKLFLLDPTGEKVSLWDLKINDLISIDFGQLDYGDDSINIIEIILNVEKAILRY